MNIGLRAAATGVLAAMIVVGCSSTVGDDSRPAAEAGSSNVPLLPQRPHESRIDDFDPCSAFTQDQLRRLNVGGSRFSAADDQFGPTCQWRHGPGEPLEGYLIERIANRSAEAAISNPRGATVILIAGYPAIETQGLYAPREKNCLVVVDVADRQAMKVQYDYGGTTLPMTRELACEKARFAAELAMQTLIERTAGG